MGGRGTSGGGSGVGLNSAQYNAALKLEARAAKQGKSGSFVKGKSQNLYYRLLTGEIVHREYDGNGNPIKITGSEPKYSYFKMLSDGFSHATGFSDKVLSDDIKAGLKKVRVRKKK